MNGLTVGKGRILACLTNQRVLGRERIDGGANSIVLRGRQVATAGPSARRVGGRVIRFGPRRLPFAVW